MGEVMAEADFSARPGNFQKKIQDGNSSGRNSGWPGGSKKQQGLGSWERRS
jgi:hypothetical protein